MRIGVRLVGTRVHGGQAVIRRVESDAVKRLEAYPAEDVEMELPGTATPGDEFHEEPHLEEAKVPEEIPSEIWDTPARLCCVALYDLVEPIGSRSELRVDSKCDVTNLRKATCLLN